MPAAWALTATRSEALTSKRREGIQVPKEPACRVARPAKGLSPKTGRAVRKDRLFWE